MIDLLQQLLLNPEQRLENLLQFSGLEYNALTSQQTSRAGWRDAALATAVASIGAVVYAALTAASWLPWALLALPVATSISAWVYIANERMVGLIQGSPDSDGWLALEAVTGQRERRLRLDPLAHRPVVEERTFASFDELPWEMREEAMIQIWGFRRNSLYELDGEQVYIEVGDGIAPLRRDANSVIRVSIGRRPLRWLRELVEG